MPVGAARPTWRVSAAPAPDVGTTAHLYRDRWFYLVVDDHPEAGEHLTLADLARLPWVTYRRTYDAPAARQIGMLGMLGIEPRVEASVDSFQPVPQGDHPRQG